MTPWPPLLWWDHPKGPRVISDAQKRRESQISRLTHLRLWHSSLLCHGRETWPLAPGPPHGRMPPKDHKPFLASEGHYVQKIGQLRRF